MLFQPGILSLWLWRGRYSRLSDTWPWWQDIQGQACLRGAGHDSNAWKHLSLSLSLLTSAWSTRSSCVWARDWESLSVSGVGMTFLVKDHQVAFCSYFVSSNVLPEQDDWCPTFEWRRSGAKAGGGWHNIIPSKMNKIHANQTQQTSSRSLFLWSSGREYLRKYQSIPTPIDHIFIRTQEETCRSSSSYFDLHVCVIMIE
jgi:hypothetical protein